MKRLYTFAISSMAALALFVANNVASTYCFLMIYEPEVPDCLKK